MERVFEEGDYDGSANFEIPSGFTEIGESAFSGSRALTSIKIPQSVTTIGENAFVYCESLKEVIFGDSEEYPSSVTTIGERAFCMCTALPMITLPDSVAKIEDGAFEYCCALTSIVVSSSIEIINDYTFSFCRSLTKVILPDGLKEIGTAAFRSCYALESITLPEGLTKIGWLAFQECRSLASFVFPSSLVSIDGNDEVFDGPDNASLRNPPPSENGVFLNCESLNTLVFMQKFNELREPDRWATHVIFLPHPTQNNQPSKIYVRPGDVRAFTTLCSKHERKAGCSVEILPLPTLDPIKIRALVSKDLRIMRLQSHIYPPISNRPINLGELTPYTANQKQWITTFMMAAYVASKMPEQKRLPYLPVEIRNTILEFLKRDDADSGGPLAITETKKLFLL